MKTGDAFRPGSFLLKGHLQAEVHLHRERASGRGLGPQMGWGEEGSVEAEKLVWSCLDRSRCEVIGHDGGGGGEKLKAHLGHVVCFCLLRKCSKW